VVFLVLIRIRRFENPLGGKNENVPAKSI